MSGSTNYDMQGHKRLRLEFDYGDAAYSDCIHAPPDTSKFWHESSVNVFEINDSHADYLANLDDAAFMKHLQERCGTHGPGQSLPPELTVVIVPLDKYEAGYGRRQHWRLKMTSGLMKQLVEAFDIPRVWLASYLEMQHLQFSRVVNCCFVDRHPQGPSHLRCFYTYRGGWESWHGLDSAPACVYFEYDFKTWRSRYVLINPSSEVTRTLQAISGRGNISAHAVSPSFVHVLVLDDTCSRMMAVARKLRSDLLYFEQDQTAYLPKELSRTTEILHQLAKDWNILEEDLNNIDERIAFLKDIEKRLLELSGDRRGPDAQDLGREYVSTTESLECLLCRLQHLRRWVSNYRRRTEIRINLVFNMAAQTDSSTNLTIAARTGDIAREAQKDSASMITIAAVTLFFLPGTFVSAFFSMTFFSYSPLENGTEEFRVSKLYWLYLAITIPLTFIVLGIWFAWRHWRIKHKAVVPVPFDERVKVVDGTSKPR